MVFVAGHFGEWMQGRLGPDGPVVLVTLTCPTKGVRGLRLGDGPLSIDGTPGVLNEDQARRCLLALGAAPTGRFALAPDLPPGGGAGMSTAALVALVRLAGYAGPNVAEACLVAEGASDPLMLPQPDQVLWASRTASVIERFDSVQPCAVVGGFWGAPSRTDPQDLAFPDISDLVAQWPRASLAERARLASLSAERCAALRGPAGDPMPTLARKLGALGHARAHTGPARALIFAPGTVPAGTEQTLREIGLTGVFSFASGGMT
jgi:hypothetical protein